MNGIIYPADSDKVLAYQKAQEALEAIKHTAESVLDGRVTLTDEKVLKPWDGVEYWRSMWAVIRNLAADGLGENIHPHPRPPPLDE